MYCSNALLNRMLYGSLVGFYRAGGSVFVVCACMFLINLHYLALIHICKIE